ncbi:uridylate kinase PUMPKIN, chloroplastic [Quercus suber]|uniref:uridylate kinase PUMPKIN, chloroplastic n=1 Tax=Quercus suber TaxID=58331 RepID=UPI0032DE9A76
MASSDDFPLIDSSSSSPNPHAHTRHDAAAYYSTEAPFNDAESDPNNRPGGPPGAPTPPKRTASPYNYYKKHKCSNSGESENESYRKDREEWSDTAIACLLEAYTEKYNELNRGNLRGRDWEEVAEAVTDRCGGGVGGGGDKSKATYKSVEQCKNKIDNLKKRYKVELQRMSAATGSTTTTHSHWHWFKKIEAIVGNSGTANKGGGSDEDRSISHARSPRQSKRYMSSNAALTNNLKSKPISNLKWRRVVFKISGTALAGNCQSIDPKVAMQVAKEVASACRIGVEVAIVVGGRNFFCGDTWVSATGLDRPTAYQIGMMATVMNSILLQSALEKLGVQTRVQSAFAMPEVAEPYSRQRAIRHLEKGRVVIFGGVGAGTGNPLFTTDTAAALRASELNADAVLKGTSVNGVYDFHSGNSNVILDHISYRDAISSTITSMDLMAITYCEENGIPVVVFNLLEPGNISRALCGDQVGTLIDQAGSIS